MTAILGRTGNLVGFTTGRGTTPWNTEMEAALRKQDAMLASTVVAITNTLPGSANEGDLYLVGTSPTGVAAGWANRIARWRSSPAGWEAYQPMQGWIITIVGETTDKVRRYNGTAWTPIGNDVSMGSISGLAAALDAKLDAANPVVTDTLTTKNLKLSGGTAGALMRLDGAKNVVASAFTENGAEITALGSDIWARSLTSAQGASDSVGNGAQLGLEDAKTGYTKRWIIQLGASNSLDLWNYASGSWTKRWQFLSNGSLAQGGSPRITAGGDGRFVGLRASEVAGTGTRPLVALSDGTIDDQDASTFRSTIGAAPSPSRATISASTSLGGISASAIYIPATDVNMTLDGGVDGQGWDIYSTLSFGLVVPSGTSLYAYNGIDTGPTTRPVGGGRAIRVVRLTATIWLVPNMSW